MGDAIKEEGQSQHAPSVQCPCRDFSAVSKVVRCLQSEEDTARLITWLEGEFDDAALERNRRVSCGKRPRCRFRVGTSFAILNAIRDACAVHLENGDDSRCGPPAAIDGNSEHGGIIVSGRTASDSQATKSGEDDAARERQEYSEAFPSLRSERKANVSKRSTSASPSSSKVKAKVKIKATIEDKRSNAPIKPPASASTSTSTSVWTKKKKKRIRPQLTTITTSTPSNSVWANPAMASAPVVASPRSAMLRSAATPFQPSGRPTQKSQDRLHLTTASQLSTSKAFPNHDMNTRIPKPKSEEAGGGLHAVGTATRNLHSEQHAEAIAVAMPNADTSAKVATDDELQRLVMVYSSLIYSHVVPSTLLELHLLLRLLNVRDPQHQPQKHPAHTTPPHFAFIFHSANQCRDFAKRTLVQLQPVILHLNPPIIAKLAALPAFRNAAPQLSEQLKQTLRWLLSQGYQIECASEEIAGSHAILSQHFNSNRDSRHNYKTQAETAVYKNREETRDAFLYQLRSYISIKGKILNPQEGQEAMKRIRAQSRTILSRLSRSNFPWFAEFFCDLLLQIGYSPIEETDEELLTIANKERLQQLQKRMSARTSNVDKSSQKIAMPSHTNDHQSIPHSNNHSHRHHSHQRQQKWRQGPRRGREEETAAVIMEVQQLFPGHQEFFYIFLQSTDQYAFGMHFKSRLGNTIRILRNRIPTVGKEELHVLKLQLLAKFLGCLVFSPNWQPLDANTHQLHPQSTVDAFKQLEAVGVELGGALDDAWRVGTLDYDLPWIMTVLKFSKWDALSQTSRTFRSIAAKLRLMQLKLSSTRRQLNMGTSTSGVYLGSPNLTTSFMLENFFEQTIGLAKLGNLPYATLPDVDVATSTPTSTQQKAVRISNPANEGGESAPRNTWLSATSSLLMNESSTHADDLRCLLDELSSDSPSSTRPTTHKARKVRPSSVSAADQNPNTKLSDMLIIPAVSEASDEMDQVSPVSAPRTVAATSIGTIQLRTTQPDGASTTEDKLHDSFFHQHVDLASICDLSITQVLKGFHNDVHAKCVRPAFDSLHIASAADWESVKFDKIERTAKSLAYEQLESQLRDTTRKVLAILVPTPVSPSGTTSLLPLPPSSSSSSSSTSCHIVDTAASLATKRGLKKGKPFVDVWVSEQCKRHRNQLLKMAAINTANLNGANIPTDAGTTATNVNFSNETDELRLVIEKGSELLSMLTAQAGMGQESGALIEAIGRLDRSINELEKDDRNQIPGELLARDLFAMIYRFDAISYSLVKSWSQASNDTTVSRHPVLASRYLGVISKLSKHSTRGMRHFESAMALDVDAQQFARACRHGANSE